MRITTVGSFAIAVAATHRVGEQRQFAHQRAGAGGDLLAFEQRVRLQQQRAFLHDIAAIGEFAGVEQHRAALQIAVSAPIARMRSACLPSAAKVGTCSKKAMSSSRDMANDLTVDSGSARFARVPGMTE